MKKYMVRSVIILFSIIFLAWNYNKEYLNPNHINIYFHLNLFKPGVDLLNPDNLDTVSEYYLLENLSCGLIRNSKYSVTGYEGCLAERFYREDKYTWIFHIRELKWSDGTNVTSDEIVNWINSLKTSSKRHIRFLKVATSVSYNPDYRTLKIKFPFEADNTILHELSLADAGLFPNNFKEVGWGKTVGPYKVESWEPKDLVLKLSSNPYSPLFTKEMPHSVRLFKVVKPEERAKLFKEIKVDVVPISGVANPSVVGPILAHASHVFESRPIVVSYFAFNKKNESARKLENRKLFAALISRFRPRLNDLSGAIVPLEAEEQLIPLGFNGRLPKVRDEGVLANNKLNKIQVRAIENFKGFNGLLLELKKFFSQNGITLEIEFSDDQNLDESQFAFLTSFLANQMDPTGSWSFLAGPPSGPLSGWYDYYEDFYKKAFSSPSLQERKINLDYLHKIVLEKYFAVPFSVSKQRYALSERIIAERWNVFDARLRIYELRFK